VRTLLLPRLGQTMDEGLLVDWLVEVGEEFDVGAPLYEVETEKVSTSVDATTAGRMVRLLVAANERVAVGTVLGVVAAQGEAPTEEEIESLLAAS
jgi:pyruvate dehydrogenase E2 component (dihydrolipoamide acetyltransferase)